MKLMLPFISSSGALARWFTIAPASLGSIPRHSRYGAGRSHFAACELTPVLSAAQSGCGPSGKSEMRSIPQPHLLLHYTWMLLFCIDGCMEHGSATIRFTLATDVPDRHVSDDKSEGGTVPNLGPFQFIAESCVFTQTRSGEGNIHSRRFTNTSPRQPGCFKGVIASRICLSPVAVRVV